MVVGLPCGPRSTVWYTLKSLSSSIRQAVVPSFDVSNRLINSPIWLYASETSSMNSLPDSSDISSHLSFAIASCFPYFASVKAIFSFDEIWCPATKCNLNVAYFFSSAIIQRTIDPQLSWQGRHLSVWGISWFPETLKTRVNPQVFCLFNVPNSLQWSQKVSKDHVFLTGKRDITWLKLELKSTIAKNKTITRFLVWRLVTLQSQKFSTGHVIGILRDGRQWGEAWEREALDVRITANINCMNFWHQHV